jgi:hypothetical protein
MGHWHWPGLRECGAHAVPLCIPGQRRRAPSSPLTWTISTSPRWLADVGSGIASRGRSHWLTTVCWQISIALRSCVHVVRPRCPPTRNCAGTNRAVNTDRHAQDHVGLDPGEVGNAALGIRRDADSHSVGSHHWKRTSHRWSRQGNHNCTLAGIATRLVCVPTAIAPLASSRISAHHAGFHRGCDPVDTLSEYEPAPARACYAASCLRGELSARSPHIGQLRDLSSQLSRSHGLPRLHRMPSEQSRGPASLQRGDLPCFLS